MCNYSDYVVRSTKDDTQKENVIRMSSKGKDAVEIADLLDMTVEKVKEILQGAPATV